MRRAMQHSGISTASTWTTAQAATPIGGIAPGSGNLISGNSDEGVEIAESTTSGNTVIGNFIGTDATGNGFLGNGGDGVLLQDAPGNIIGGTTAAERNIISGNTGNGVHIAGSNATLNTIQGNYIGVGLDGFSNVDNDGDGVRIDDNAEGTTTAAANNLVGGTAAGAGNVISGNKNNGVSILGGASGNTLQGNYIGVTAAGDADRQNDNVGVRIDESPGNVIGGAVAGAGNVISGNKWSGVVIEGGASDGNVVQGNLVGTDATGTFAIQNNAYGITIWGGPDNNTIGGTTAAERNVISGNKWEGVSISGSATTGNTVSGNYIGT